MAAPAPKPVVNQVVPARTAAAPAFPRVADKAGIGVEALHVVPRAQLRADVPELLAAKRNMVVSRASRAGQRSVLPGCTGIAPETDAANGQIPTDTLCTLWDHKNMLRADAAVAFAKMNVAFKQNFDDNLCITDSYRTLAEQYRLRSIKPGLAAQAGKSNHGLGVAVDLCDGVEKGAGARFQWLRTNAGDFGWTNPDWAQPGGPGPYEPWHWEYDSEG
jgi:hypothetical protein